MPKNDEPIAAPGDPRELEGVFFNRDSKFDLQLSEALIRERRLAEIFAYRKIEKMELKTETYQWEKTGNICIEFRRNGRPSGISVTEADYWVHELRREQRTLVYNMFPMDRLKTVARAAYRAGRWRTNSGDQGKSDVVLIRVRDILG